MFATNEQLSKLSLSGVESALRFAQISLDSAERLVKLNLELSKQSLEGNVKAARDLAGVSDPQEVFSRVNQIASQSVEQAVAGSRSAYEIVSQSQTELSSLIEENVNAFNKALISSVETFAKSQPTPGADVAVNGLKNALAATSAAVNTFAKATQQAGQFADASFKAAGQATTEAVKATAKRA